MIRKVSYIFVFFTALNIYSCCNCDDVGEYFDINSMSVKASSKGQTLSADTNVRVDFDAYDIHLIFGKRFYSQASSPFNCSNILFNTAYACKCKQEGVLGSKEIIERISIFSNNKFDSLGNTSDTLNSYFEVTGGKNYTPINDFKDLNTFLLTKPKAFENIYIRLKTKPTGSLQHQFTIEYKQTNGEIYKATLPTIRFNQ
jgi:hypothetical protein